MMMCCVYLRQQEAGALERTQQKQISGLFNAAKMVYRLGGVGGFFQVRKQRDSSQRNRNAHSRKFIGEGLNKT